MTEEEKAEEGMRVERDQYAAAIRQLILQVRQTSHLWVTTLPETLHTKDVAKALMGLCSPLPLPDDLRDDLWQRIAGAYYLRFENDGHPEDSKIAADVAVSIVQPELDRLTNLVDEIREYAKSRCIEDHGNVASAFWILHLIEKSTPEKQGAQT